MDCVWNGVSGVACVKIVGLCGICIFENKYFVCERVRVRRFDGCEIFRIFILIKRTKPIRVPKNGKQVKDAMSVLAIYDI
jgi:hypothetical protein